MLWSTQDGKSCYRSMNGFGALAVCRGNSALKRSETMAERIAVNTAYRNMHISPAPFTSRYLEMLRRGALASIFHETGPSLPSEGTPTKRKYRNLGWVCNTETFRSMFLIPHTKFYSKSILSRFQAYLLANYSAYFINGSKMKTFKYVLDSRIYPLLSSKSSKGRNDDLQMSSPNLWSTSKTSTNTKSRARQLTIADRFWPL